MINNENCKPSKSKSKEKIDGAVAGVMAKAAHLSVKDDPSLPENWGLTFV